MRLDHKANRDMETISDSTRMFFHRDFDREDFATAASRVSNFI